MSPQMIPQDSSTHMFLTVVTLLASLVSVFVSAQNNCEIPEAVNNLKSENTTPTTTHLSWQPPASTECLDHYKITYCSYLGDKCSNKTIVLSLNTTLYVVTGLKPCTSNAIQVHSVGKDNTESYIGIIIYTGNGDPPKVEKVNFKHVALTYITIGWDTPRNFNDQCYPGFKVCYSTDRDNTETCYYTVVDKYNTSSVVSSLSPCTQYNFSVATVDGDFAADSKTSEKTYVSVFTAPQAPNFTVTVHNHTAHATWKTPDALSKTCAASYEVKNCRITDTETDDCTAVSSQTLPLNATEATITGLDSCSNNHISVNLVGLNGQTSSKEVVILDQDIEIPVPTVDSVSVLSSSEFTVDYKKGVNDCVSSYRACWFTGSEAEKCKNTTGSYGAVITDPELKPCFNYTLHFNAIGVNGKSSKNFTGTFFTGPINVLDLTAEAKSQSILLSWKVTPSALQCGTHYKITWETVINLDIILRSVTLPVNATSYNITNLTSCAAYTISIYTSGNHNTQSADEKVYISAKCGLSS